MNATSHAAIKLTRTLYFIGPKHMTIAKIYAAKLIWENYKNMKKFGQRRRSIYPVSWKLLKDYRHDKGCLYILSEFIYCQ